MTHKRSVSTAITVIKALIARCFFIIHMLFAIGVASCVAGSTSVWALMTIFVLFVIETIYSIVKRKGQEPKWFSPCIFLYLLTVIPPIWILNLDTFHCFDSTQRNGNGSCVGLPHHAKACSLVPIDRYFDRKPLAYTMEEIMLLLLILGRWLLPKGTVSHVQLSELLFIYFGISFDLLELFYLFEERDILRSETMYHVILAIWSFSLFQFTIVLTAVKSRRPNISFEATPLRRLTSVRCCQFEIWGLLTTVVMQDGPFLILRLYCLIGMKLFSYNLLFYTIKNILVVTLQAYRFTVLLLHCRQDFDPNMLPTISTVSTSLPTTSTVSTTQVSSGSEKSGTPTKAGPPDIGRSGSNMSLGTSFNTLSYNHDYSFESTV